MSPSWLFWWIYQLSLGETLFLLLAYTLIYLWLHRQMEGWRRQQSFAAAVLMIWLAAVFYVTLLNRSEGAVDVFQRIPLHSYREMLETGNREILRSNFMNVVLFYPAGLLLAALLPKRWRFPVRVAVFAVFSLSIEIVQHVLLLGRGEIDDVLHNTLGAMIGCLSFSLKSKLFP